MVLALFVKCSESCLSVGEIFTVITSRTKRDELTNLLADEMNLNRVPKALFRCSCPNTGSPEGLIKTLLCVHSIYVGQCAKQTAGSVRAITLTHSSLSEPVTAAC